MCPKCPRVSTIGEAHIIRNECIYRIDKAIKRVNAIEDAYRDNGINYHRTEMSFRASLPYDREYRLGELFETFSVEEYNRIFQPLIDAMKALVSLRDRLPSKGSPQELVHQFYQDSMFELLEKIYGFGNKLMEDCKDISASYDAPLAERWYREASEGYRSGHVPISTEWFAYRDWVASLPENYRIVELEPDRRDLDTIALDLLCGEPEKWKVPTLFAMPRDGR
ncbi:hypothetical protein GQ44DRAFT_734334 [Phaeosphaeriaceae sp. PMI808]|nr:hypothetical protein GQ44DRAFT_734334 [Phaeosphaeriaceae sp. PMI808]